MELLVSVTRRTLRAGRYGQTGMCWRSREPSNAHFVSIERAFSSIIVLRYSPGFLGKGYSTSFPNGFGLGKLEDNSQAAVIVYVEKTKAKPNLPERVDDVPVRMILTDPFVAY
jgi:hypothetical protein